MGTIRQMLNQSLLISIGLVLFVAADLGFTFLENYPIMKQIGAWLIFMGAGIALYNRFTKPDRIGG
jgi:hypothetical protein